MDSQDLHNLQEAYSNVYEQQIGVPLKDASDRAAKDQLKKMIPKGEKVYTPKATLQNAAYEPEGDEIDEMAMNPNSRFTTASQRREYAANQIGSKEFSDRGGHAALKAGGGQAALKRGSSVSDVLHAGKRAMQAKRKQEFNNRINQSIRRPNPQPANTQPAPVKKPMDDFAAGGGNAKMKQTGMTRDQVIALGKKNLANSYEPDAFDVILEYLVAEGYADTNDNALVIMVNMSEEWRQSIIEKSGEKPLPYGRMMKKSDELAASDDPEKQKRAATIYLAANSPKGPKVKVRK